MVRLKERHLAAVSWCMPPALFPRSIQVARTLKGLARQGWSSTVVTPRIQDLAPGDELDTALADAYGDQAVARIDPNVPDLERFPTYRQWTQNLEGRSIDPDLVWAEAAAATVRRINRERHVDALVTFAQPWRDHLAGLQLLRWRRIRPWIAHFSDPWVDSPYANDASSEEQQRQRKRESRVVRSADMLVFTNRYAADLVMAKYPPTWRRKVRVVPHAVDRDLPPLVDALFPRRTCAPARPFRLSHVGNLFVGRRTAHALFEAIAALQRTRPLDGQLDVVFVGAGSGWDEARQHAAALGVRSLVTFRGRVSHFESLAAMRDSDALVMIDAPAETNVFLPSKVADYLMYAKPVLALTPGAGPSADLIREAGGRVVDPQDVPGIVNALDALMRDHDAGHATTPAMRAVAERCDLDAVAARFAEILDEALSERKGMLPWLGLR